jgi:iron complex outermembrane receptor protein
MKQDKPQVSCRRVPLYAAIGGLSAAAIMPIAVVAQEESRGAQSSRVEEIVVTASRRSQSLSKVPMAISAIDEQRIEQYGYTNLESFFRSVPSVTLVDGGAQRKQVIIRGLAIESGVRAESLSSIYVDEALVSGGSFNLDPRIFDMERVELLKGPQGTLYGGGSISGSTRYITNKPDSREFGANIALDTSITEGSDLGHSVDAMVNVPIIEDVLALRAVGFFADNVGFYDNTYLNKDDQGGFEQKGGRVALRWTPHDRIALTASYFLDQTDQDGWYRATGPEWEKREQENRMDERLTADAEIVSLQVEVDLGWANVTSATSQLDRTFLGIDNFLDSARLAVLDDTRDSTFAEELRIVSAPDAFGNFDWIAGVYYSDIEVDVDVGDYIGIGDEYDQVNAGDRFAAASPDQDFVFPFPEGYVSPFGLQEVPGTYPDMIYREIVRSNEEQLAFFGELTYNFTPQLSATVGYRDTETTTGGGFVNQVADAGEPVFSENVITEEYKEPHQNYMLNLTYAPTDDFLVFARAAEGFRVGTGGAGPTIQPSCQALAEQTFGFKPGPIESDEMWGYEAGTKLSLMDGKMKINAGVFQNEWSDIQVDVNLDGNATCSISVTQNVASATGIGFEFDMNYYATERLAFTAAASWIDFSLDDDQPFLNALDGDRLPSHPDYTLYGAADYNFPFMGLSGFVRGEVSYTGEILGGFNADGGVPRTSFGEYTLANTRLGVASDHWEAALYVNNVFDEDALTFQFADRRNRIESLVNRPRTIGINFRTRF